MKKSRPYILLIDDDEDDLYMFSSEMEKKGIKVKAFESPASALTYLTYMLRRKKLPALIIIDYNMPKKNGLQVLVLIKGNAETKDIPVVIYSNHVSDVLNQQLLKSGALHCVDKSWDTLEFETHIQGFKDMVISFTKDKTVA